MALPVPCPRYPVAGPGRTRARVNRGLLMVLALVHRAQEGEPRRHLPLCTASDAARVPLTLSYAMLRPKSRRPASASGGC